MLELYVRLVNWIKEQQEGQDLVEYAILLALIALVVWVAVQFAGQQVNNIWKAIQGGLTNVIGNM
jgi:pilus assembly protein Flp/PilA